MKLKIAGHEWQDQNPDSCCILAKSNGDACRMTRAALFQAIPSDVSKEGYAHTLSLSQSEYNDISTARNDYEAYCDKLIMALRG
jgi:hypothetical protein